MQVYFTLQAVFQDEEDDRDTSFVSENTDSLYLMGYKTTESDCEATTQGCHFMQNNGIRL